MVNSLKTINDKFILISYYAFINDNWTDFKIMEIKPIFLLKF
jgi:hypothetical protein